MLVATPVATAVVVRPTVSVSAVRVWTRDSVFPIVRSIFLHDAIFLYAFETIWDTARGVDRDSMSVNRASVVRFALTAGTPLFFPRGM